MPKAKSSRWSPTEEKDELVFAVCDRFLAPHKLPQGEENEQDGRGNAAAIAHWLQTERGRPELTREKVYPLIREAMRRGFLVMQPPLTDVLRDRLAKAFSLEQHHGKITIVNATGPNVSEHIARVAVDRVIELINEVAQKKRAKALQQGINPDDIQVHLGMGAGFVAMLVAKKLARMITAGQKCPPLVLHAISSGGFFLEQPQKSPITYFTYFDELLSQVKFVALFSETVVREEDYEKVTKGLSVKPCFDQKNDIDIIVTSLASANDQHGLIRQYFSHLIKEKSIADDVLNKMEKAGWVGDVQFRPYTKNGPLEHVSPVRAVALFELDEMVAFANTPDKYVVLVAAPCGECRENKVEAVRPLLENKSLRLWTDLVTDIGTANELLQ